MCGSSHRPAQAMPPAQPAPHLVDSSHTAHTQCCTKHFSPAPAPPEAILRQWESDSQARSMLAHGEHVALRGEGGDAGVQRKFGWGAGGIAGRDQAGAGQGVGSVRGPRPPLSTPPARPAPTTSQPQLMLQLATSLPLGIPGSYGFGHARLDGAGRIMCARPGLAGMGLAAREACDGQVKAYCREWKTKTQDAGGSGTVCEVTWVRCMGARAGTPLSMCVTGRAAGRNQAEQYY